MKTESTYHLPSTWRDPIGPLLTDTRIRAWERKGWYGVARKAMALRRHMRLKKHVYMTPDGIVQRCERCGSREFVDFRKWDWLPKKGLYCERCVASLRWDRDADKRKRQEFLARIKEEYV